LYWRTFFFFFFSFFSFFSFLASLASSSPEADASSSSEASALAAAAASYMLRQKNFKCDGLEHSKQQYEPRFVVLDSGLQTYEAIPSTWTGSLTP
jgi:hypothetical protein